MMTPATDLTRLLKNQIVILEALLWITEKQGVRDDLEVRVRAGLVKRLYRAAAKSRDMIE
jgi:hypothetical protein